MAGDDPFDTESDVLPTDEEIDQRIILEEIIQDAPVITSDDSQETEVLKELEEILKYPKAPDSIN